MINNGILFKLKYSFYKLKENVKNRKMMIIMYISLNILTCNFFNVYFVYYTYKFNTYSDNILLTMIPFSSIF